MDYLARLSSRREGLLSEVRTVLTAAAEADLDLTDDESEKIKASHAEIRALDEQIVELEDLAAREIVATESRKAEGTDEVVRPSVVVTSEARTYSPDSENNFLSDAYAAFRGESLASERINRHQHEESIERRDVGTGAFTGLVIPQYLVNLFAEKARAGRPFANVCDSQPLPAAGMTINIGRVTTGSAAAAQATENSAVQETDMDDTLLTVNVRTIAGQQDLSRQLLERGEAGTSNLVFADLISAYHTELDRGIINDPGTSGTHLGLVATSGINTTTYTDTNPTVSELYPKLADAIQEVNSNRFLPPSVIVMHPRRWAFFTAAVDGSNRPLVVPNASPPQNAIGTGDAAAYGQVVGQLMGLPVVCDASVPTTWSSGSSNTSGDEDVIIVARAADLHLWETPNAPIQARFEETGANTLTVKLVAYGYSAFTAGRYPTAVSLIKGTGLAAPTF